MTKIPALSPTLQKTLLQTLEKLQDQTNDSDIATLLAMQQIVTRIELGEQNLYEPLHRGDLLAITLATLK